MSDASVVPDRIGVVIGWRAWRVETSGDDVLLLSVTHPEPWLPGMALEAVCHRHHDPPAENCACGIYAAVSLAHLQTMGYHYFQEKECAVVGEVALWGRVVEGTHGRSSPTPAACSCPMNAGDSRHPCAPPTAFPCSSPTSFEQKEVSRVDIGEEQETYTIEPVESPVPVEVEPDPQPEKEPEPEVVPV